MMGRWVDEWMLNYQYLAFLNKNTNNTKPYNKLYIAFLFLSLPCFFLFFSHKINAKFILWIGITNIPIYKLQFLSSFRNKNCLK